MGPETLETLARAAREAAADRRANGISGNGPDGFDTAKAEEYESAAEEAHKAALRRRLGRSIRAVEKSPGHWRALYSSGPGRVMRTVTNEAGLVIEYMTERHALEAAAQARKETFGR